MKRCLIIGCSKSKIKSPGHIPALQRYDGPSFRVLRRFLAAESPPHAEGKVDVFILSAEFGLIKGAKPICVYDRRLTRRRAGELRPMVLDSFKDKIAAQNYAQLFLSMGQTYLLALAGYEDLLPPTIEVKVSKGTFGRKLTELKAWLNGREPPAQLPLPLVMTVENGRFPRRVRGAVRLQGTNLNFSPDEVYRLARLALAAKKGRPYNFKNWYVLVEGRKVAPKWLAGQLAQLPVSRFDTGAARRVLKALGIPVYPNK